jgi:hypothetical protein
MSSVQPFKTDYSEPSQTTAERGEKPVSVRPVTQTVSDRRNALPAVVELVKLERYGTGKPRRVKIRGKISRD